MSPVSSFGEPIVNFTRSFSSRLAISSQTSFAAPRLWRLHFVLVPEPPYTLYVWNLVTLERYQLSQTLIYA